ncbi:MAG: Panacea domain-containing protein [Mycoplasmatales bacterium]
MYTVFEIANYYFHQEKMTHKKMQKMVYYAYCWSLVLMGKKVFEPKFEAWVNGPVCRELWNKYHHYHFEKIDPNDDISEFSLDFLNVLESVWLTYGHLSGPELEILSHSEEPWLKARKGIPDYAATSEILDDQIIIEYYSKHRHEEDRDE